MNLDAPTHPSTERGYVEPPSPTAKFGLAPILLLIVLMIALMELGRIVSGPNPWIYPACLVAYVLMIVIKPLRPIAAIPIVLVLAPYMLRKQVLEFSAKPVHLDAIPDHFVPPLRETLERFQSEFIAAGFTPAGLWRTGRNAGATTFTLTFDRPWHNACIVAFNVNIKGALLGRPMMQCHTRAGDQNISTYNAAALPVFPVRPGARIRLHAALQLDQIIEVQEAMIRHFARGRTLTNPAADGWAAYIASNDQAHMQYWQSRGFIRPLSADAYGITWKGAFRSALSMLWPINTISMARDRSKNRELLRTIGAPMTYA